ncbi:hypothetical protein T4D_7780 [Trichinella pseudospiralis]|uniref:DUF5641 domain-containing protein n=1 Tax=Trichinella pseudospiralis TaxID=6337 RepID=A0A0V1FEP6_TRIPS|nr:hypothetical protein T4D_7780 [Trichinella pseudospiralis]
MVVSVIHLMISVRYDDPQFPASAGKVHLEERPRLIQSENPQDVKTDAEEQTLRTVLGEIKARINNELLAVISHKQLCRRQRGVDTCSFLYRKGIIVTARPKQHRQWWYQRKLLEHLCTRWKRETANRGCGVDDGIKPLPELMEIQENAGTPTQP